MRLSLPWEWRVGVRHLGAARRPGVPSFVAAISVMSGGKPNSFRVRFTDVYTNRGGTWQMVTWQSTRLAD